MKKPLQKPRKQAKFLKANGLVLEDPEGRARIILDATRSDGAALITMHGISGGTLLLCMDRDGLPKASFGDPSGKTRLAFGLNDRGEPGMSLHNHRGEIVALVSVGVNQKLSLSVVKNAKMKRIAI